MISATSREPGEFHEWIGLTARWDCGMPGQSGTGGS